MADSAGKAAPGRRVDRTAQPEDLMMVLPAVPASVRAARTRIRHWLDCLACPLPVADDVELAVNEAIANVVDHAYPPDAPGQANLHAWVAVHPSTRQPRVVVAVTDHGRWAAHQPDTPTPAAHGHGLIVMSACMDELHIQRAASGTTVIMISASISATGRTPAAAPPPTPDT